MSYDPNVIKLRDFFDGSVAYFDSDRMVYVMKNGEEWSKEFVDDRRWYAAQAQNKDYWNSLPWWKRPFSRKPFP
jgi:hypothetical protein